MNYEGIIIGIASFAIIGLFHPLVIKSEYYIGKKIWPAFLLAGIGLIAWSLFIDSFMISAIVAVVACLWSIHEIIKQEERLKVGSANPKSGS